MATVTKTFTFATTAEGFTATQAASTTLSYDAATGNPAGALKARKSGRNLSKTTSYWEWAGTWEDLGVPAGATVDSVRLLSASTRCTEYNVGSSSTIGPYEIYDAASTLAGTLWAGRTITAVDASWVSTATQTGFTLGGGNRASNATIKIRLADQLATGNNNSAAVSTYDDQVSIEITYFVTTPMSASDSGSISATESASVVPSTPPASIQAPWVGTATVGNGSGAAATSATVNVSGATDGEVVWIFGSIGDAQTAAITAPSGWNVYAQTSEGTSGGSSSRDVILWKVKSSGDTNVTVNWTVSANYQFVPVSWGNVDTSTPAEGIAWVNHTTGTVYPTGTSTPSGANRWAVAFVTSRGSTAITPFTNDPIMVERVDVINSGAPFIGLTVADSNSEVTAVSQSYSFTGQTASHGIGGLFFLIPKPSSSPPPDVTLSVSDSGTFSATEASSASPFTPTLPGRIGGVEPESHAHNPPVLAPNGALYRVSESDTASGNHPMMFKSTDGGATWIEMDSANRPTAQDLEGTWIALDGTTIIFTVNRDDTVWWCPFNTTTDTWGTQETIDTGLSTTGVEQYSSFVKNNDGTYWIFYSDTLSGTLNQIAYRKRTGTNTYGTKSTAVGGNTSVSYTAPASIKAASDLTYVFYKDDTNNTLYYRTLTTAGTLSGANSVATGTATDNIPHTNAVYFDDGGTETVVCAYADSSDILKLVVLKNGVQQTTETISASAILMDPGSVTNGGTVAHLAVNGSTLYAVWADGATGDIMFRSRQASGAWSSVSTLWNSGANEAWYVYNTVYTYGGKIRMGYVYDVTHAVDVSDLYYNEVDLGSASTPVNVSDTGSLSATDTSTLSAVVSVNDTGSLSATDTSVNTSALTRTDTGSLSATDASTVFKAIGLTDTGSISATDSSNVFNDRPATDSGVFSATDTSSIVVGGQIDLSGNDTGSLSGLDASSLVVNTAVAVTDSGALSATETSAVLKAIGLTDTGSLSATDVSVSSSTLSRTDTGSIGATDTIGVFYTTAATDTGSISATDASSLVVSGQTNVNVSDTGSLSAIDTSSVSVSNAVSVNDTGTFSATDTSAVYKTIALADTGTFSATDVSNSFRTIALTDSGSVSATDTANVFNDRPGTDSGTFSAVDTSSVVVSGQTNQSANDTGSLSGLDASSVKSSLALTDTGSISATDSSAAYKQIAINDTGALSATDTSGVRQTKSINDAGSLSAADTASVVTFESGIIWWQWNGTAMVQLIGMKRWNGTSYDDIQFKRWDGSQFS